MDQQTQWRLWRDGHPLKQLGGRYTLLRPLVGGNMADVYVAWDERDHHGAVIKVIKPEMFDPTVLQRFLREGAVVASLDHPHLIRIYGNRVQEEIVTNPDSTNAAAYKVPYIVMEHVTGGDLKKRLVAGQPHPLDEIVRIFEQLCAAVQYAHKRGVIHRDIKPANILFREHPQKGDQVVLSDFGLALLVDHTHISLPFAGSPAYMAPEQRNGTPEFASDIFSLGVVLYQLSTGQLPSRPPRKPTLLNPSLPLALDDVILCALSSEPSQRFASADLFWQAIQSAMREGEDKKVDNYRPNRAQPITQPLPSINQPVLPVTPATPNQVSSVPGQPSTPPQGNGSIVQNQPKPIVSYPPLSFPPRPTIPSSTKPKWRALLMVALIILVLLFLLGSWAAFAPPSGVRDRIGSIITPPPPATVTITPPSKTVQDTYVMSGINGSTDVDNRQISVRQLSSTQTVTKSVQLTHVHIVPQSATGTITFFNGSGAVLTVPKGITFNVGNVQIVTDAIAVIPAAKPPTEGQITVPAHAVQPGTAGNVAASAINGFCCDTAARISAKNQNAFIGGADLVDYNYLKPEDVTKVTNDNQGALKSSAQDDITKNKKTAGEQFLGDIKCDDPKTTADPQPNAHVESKNNTAATVTVSVTCSAQVYDNNAAKTIAQNLLKQKVSKDPALGGYVLADKNIATQIQPQQVQQNGDPTFSANAQGTAYYQWNDAMKQALLNKIKGMSVKDAQAALSNYPGVANAKIDISNGGSALPNDVNQIDVKFNNPSASSTPISLGP